MGANTTPVRSGQVAWLAHENDESTVKFETKDQNLRVILFAGKPLREPVVARGPFVMNTEEEIEQAYAEFHRDRERFGLS
jgi:redox-sensitive bicupin YhaK (pirin superfamily)